MTDIINIFTDGACSGNPGPGGWAVLLKYQDVQKELSGFEIATTNNRMELQAAIEGLKALKTPSTVHLYTDSTYLKDGMSQWIHAWKKNNWITAGKTPVKNMDLWQELDTLSAIHHIQWFWVKAHDGHPENERADLLARNAIVQAIMKQEMETS